MSADEIVYLVVDDDANFTAALARALVRQGGRAVVAHSSEEAIQVARATKPKRAIVDLRIDRESGVELIADLKSLDPAMAIVLLTGFGNIPTAVAATKAGAVQYLTKPATVAEILAAFDGDAQQRIAPETNSLDDVEWEHLSRVLAESQGNISEAARRLNMHRRTLQRKLARHR